MWPRIVQNTELKKLLLAQLPADFADWLDFVAIGTLLAYTWDAPSFAFALLAVSMGAPYLVFGPVAGALVDRWSIKTVLVWTNVVRALVTGAFFFAGDWPTLLALVALRSAVDTFFTPAKQTAIQALTKREERSSANGLSHGINQASKIVAPGAGGTVLIWYDPSAIFVLNALISASAAILAARLRQIRRPERNSASEPTGLLFGVAAGMREVRSIPAIRNVLVLMAAGYFSTFIYDTFVAPLTRDIGFEPHELGFSLAAVGTGGVLGAMLFGFLPELKHPHRWIAAGASIASVLLVVLGACDLFDLALPLVAFVAVFLVLGVTSAMSVVPFRTILQNTVSEHRMGTVTALSEALNTTAMLSAPFLGAFLATAFSVGAPFVAGGLVLAVVALIAVRTKLG